MDPPVVEPWGERLVVRDDLVEGGTKRPILEQLCGEWPSDEFVYPAASEGFGQVAIAIAARAAGKRATIFVAERKSPTVETQRALDAGAKVVGIPIGRYPLVQHRARAYAASVGARYFRPGFAHHEFLEGVAARARLLKLDPELVVVTAGSGTLCRGLQRAWPGARFRAVRVGMAPNVGMAEVAEVPERYQQAATDPPPFPSASHQDAKAWRHVPDETGVVFWNIAG